jgi:NAD(P)-dependent dehydrogenase (short-subunit alcohol dehydrogenase family)
MRGLDPHSHANQENCSIDCRFGPGDRRRQSVSKLLSNRIALVTGASRGIGAAVALKLAQAGAHVVAVARTVGGLEELDDAVRAAGGSATLVPLDMKDVDAIDRLAAVLNKRHGRLDVLVGNAAILGPLSPLAHVEPKAWDDVMAVNLTANWRLIRAFDPLLRASDAGRAVFVSSGAAYMAIAYWGPYAVSKAALELLARTYAAETASTPVRVNLFYPGPIRTRMRAQAMPGEDPMSLDTPEQVADALLPLCLPDFQESGRVYSYRARKLLSFGEPA